MAEVYRFEDIAKGIKLAITNCWVNSALQDLGIQNRFLKSNVVLL